MFQLSTSPDPAGRGMQSVELRAAFDDALPTPCWGAAAKTRILVGLARLADWQPWLPDAYEMLDASEHERIGRRRFATDRDELALAYALHRLLLGKVLDRDAMEVPIGRDSLGCPRLRGELLFTSLSHADRCVALAVTATGPVGVDLEPAARASEMPDIAGRVCHPVDAAELAAFVGPEWSAALLALWVRKEAFLKAAGIGLEREMQTFPAPDNALLTLPRLGGKPARLQMLDVGPYWVAAVAGSPDIPIESAWLRPVSAAGVAGFH